MKLIFACGRCVTPLEGPHEPSFDSVVTCLVCGASDTFANVERIVGEFVEEEAARHFQETSRGLASNSNNLTFLKTPRSQRLFRFVAIGAVD
jgi:hypothetical protein